MREWLKPLLDELEREYEKAQENLNAAHAAHFVAQEKYNTALGIRNELAELVRGLRDFAKASQGGDE